MAAPEIFQAVATPADCVRASPCAIPLCPSRHRSFALGRPARRCATSRVLRAML